MVKSFLLNLHLYVGLVFAPYFVIYGLSTLAFNHGWGGQAAVSEDSRQISVPRDLEDQDLGLAIRDSLQLIGSVPAWNMRSVGDTLTFRIRRPAVTYHVKLDKTSGEMDVRTESFGFWGVVKSLHGLRAVPQSTWSHTWAVYSEVSVWALVFAVLGGLYFWWGRAPERRIGWWAIGVGTALSALMMLYMAS